MGARWGEDIEGRWFEDWREEDGKGDPRCSVLGT